MSRHHQALFDMAHDILGSALTVASEVDSQSCAPMFACLSQFLTLPVLADLDHVWWHVTTSTGLFDMAPDTLGCAVTVQIGA